MSWHTPGPWRWDTDFKGLYNMDIPETVLDFEPWEGMSLEYHVDQDRREANANLIAAAPDLLEALIAIEAAYSQVTNWEHAGSTDRNPKLTSPVAIAARKAIARAKGEA